MSLRKTRRGTKNEDVEASMQNPDVSKIPETPETTRRTLRTRRQLKQKTSNNSDVEQSPQLNESKRQTRRGKGKIIADNGNDSITNVTITNTRKKTKKDKEVGMDFDETMTIDRNDEIQEPVSTAKPKINRSRKRGAQKKSDPTINDLDNAENFLNDRNTVRDDISIYLTNEKDNDVIGNQNNVLNVDDEVAIVSKKADKKLSKTPTVPRFLQPRSCNINSPNATVTPECSPLTVSLTPHRATKTPRKSPINLDSPKTHSISPQRISKTPRKLPVSVDSPTNFDELSIDEYMQKITCEKANNKSRIYSPNDETSVRSSNRRVLKSPKVSRTAKSKSPRVTSTKAKKSPNLKKSLHVSSTSTRAQSLENANFPISQNIENTTKSPLLILDRISPKIFTSPSTDDTTAPITSPNTAKKFVDSTESPKRQKFVKKKRSPITDSGTPIRTTSKQIDMYEESHTSQIVPSNSTPLIKLAAQTDSTMTSSTPRERIRRSLNLSPDFGASSVVSGVSLSVETFYGTSPKTSLRILNNDKCFRIEDESNVLITDDDSSFDISGVEAVDISKNNGTLADNDDGVITTQGEAEKTINDTYDLAEPVTPGLKKQNITANDTYELEEPKTPGLRKRRSSIQTDADMAENVDETIPSKRICRVRFASPPLNSPEKVVLEEPLRSSTPANKGLRKKTVNPVHKASTSNIKLPKVTSPPRRRSNSLTNLDVNTPSMSSMKKRSLSAVDVRSRSAQKTMQNESVNRLSRPRLSITSNKKTEVKTMSAKKAPNFAQIHQKKFAKMESLVDAKKRVAERHNALIKKVAVTPSAAKTVTKPTPRINNTIKVSPSKAVNGAFNRFGYRVRKEEASKIVDKRAPSKKTDDQRVEKRMALKGVRSNRRFELQMKMRGINS